MEPDEILLFGTWHVGHSHGLCSVESAANTTDYVILIC